MHSSIACSPLLSLLSSYTQATVTQLGVISPYFSAQANGSSIVLAVVQN